MGRGLEEERGGLGVKGEMGVGVMERPEWVDRGGGRLCIIIPVVLLITPEDIV